MTFNLQNVIDWKFSSQHVGLHPTSTSRTEQLSFIFLFLAEPKQPYNTMSSTPAPVSPLSTAEGAAADGALASARPGRSVLEIVCVDFVPDFT